MVADGSYRLSSHRTPTSDDSQLHWGTLDPLKECIQRSVILALKKESSSLLFSSIAFFIHHVTLYLIMGLRTPLRK